MTSDAPPVQGAVQLMGRDQQRFLVAVLSRRPFLLVAVGLIASAAAAWPLLMKQFDLALGRGHSVPAALLGTLPSIVGSALVTVPPCAALVALYIGLVVPLGVRRMGLGRRALTYRIDEGGVRTTDGLGAELVLPWSNVTRLMVTKRLLLIRLKPRGWRYLPTRAFAPQDVARIRAYASLASVPTASV